MTHDFLKKSKIKGTSMTAHMTNGFIGCLSIRFVPVPRIGYQEPQDFEPRRLPVVRVRGLCRNRKGKE